jgi:CheY-like chemotaxis protein
LPLHKPRPWARLQATLHQRYPASLRFQWLRVVEQPHPDVPPIPGYIWLDMGGKAQQVKAEDFEIVERDRPRILVVDDDPGIRQTLHIALKNAGYEVFQARDGEEGTRLWRDAGPDLVIADIHMPRKSGLLLMQELQENASSARVIAMTDGGPARQFNLLGLSDLLGAARSVPKPFKLEDMLNVVEDELSRSFT